MTGPCPGTADDAALPGSEVGVGEPLPEDRFLDRELTWLAFNQRVLELAEDRDQPLLERAKFLAIFASNLDEFFMVRVAGLKRRIATGIAVRASSGLMPREVLEAICGRSAELHARQARALPRRVLPGARGRGHPHAAVGGRLDRAERDQLSHFFRDQIFPVLTPLAVDPAHPFPYICGLSLNLAVVVRNPTHRHRAVRPRQGAADPRRASCVRSGRSASSRSRTSSPRTSASSSPAWRC